MFHDALLVAGKDLRVEWRSRVTMNQVAPFSILILVLFGFALDPQMDVLRAATPGLFWVAVLLSMLLTVQRAYAVEFTDGIGDRLRLSGLDPAGIFLGKALAIFVELVALEVLLLIGVVILYSTHITSFLLVVAACIVATVGLAAAGALYGALLGGIRGRETLLPLMLLPIVSPVLIGATTIFTAAMGADSVSAEEGWRWLGMLVVFAGVYTSAGFFAFGPLLEDS